MFELILHFDLKKKRAFSFASWIVKSSIISFKRTISPQNLSDVHDMSVTYTKVLADNCYSLNSGVNSPIATGVAYKIKHLAMQSQSTFTDIWAPLQQASL